MLHPGMGCFFYHYCYWVSWVDGSQWEGELSFSEETLIYGICSGLVPGSRGHAQWFHAIEEHT